MGLLDEERSSNGFDRLEVYLIITDYSMPGMTEYELMKKIKRLTNWPIALRKVVFRTTKLLFWGILLQGGYSHAPDDVSYGVNMKRVRWCGILQRIALAYLIVSGLEVANKNARGKSHPLGHLSVFKLYFCQWVAGLGVLVIYLSVLYETYLPDESSPW